VNTVKEIPWLSMQCDLTTNSDDFVNQYFNVSFTTNEEEKEQSASFLLKVVERMLQQNFTSEWMHILMDAIIEPKDNNSKAFVQTIHALQMSTQRKGQPIETRAQTPHKLNSVFLQKELYFRATEVYFLLGCCRCGKRRGEKRVNI
jgi:hypothetical protein